MAGTSTSTLDVVVRWHDDVIALERVTNGPHQVGPFVVARTAPDAARIDGAHVALPCVVTRGALTVTARVAVPAGRAAPPRLLEGGIDPDLVRAAGFPLVIAAALFAALAVTPAPVPDDAFVFAFDRARWSPRAARGHDAAPVRVLLLAPRARDPDARARVHADGMFAPIERVDDEGLATLLGALAEFGAGAPALPAMSAALADFTPRNDGIAVDIFGTAPLAVPNAVADDAYRDVGGPSPLRAPAHGMGRGDVDCRRALRDAVRTAMRGLNACAARWPDTALRGRIPLTWGPAEDGAFHAVRAEVEPPALAACLVDSLAAHRVDRACASMAAVTWPLIFDNEAHEAREHTAR